MNQEMNGSASRKKASLAIPILFVIALALGAANVVSFVRLDGLRQDLAALQESIAAEFAQVRDAASVSDASSRESITTLREELQLAQQRTSASTGQVRKDALKHAEQLARQIREEQAKQQEQLTGQLSEVRESASAATSRISDVSNEVNTVRTEVGSTKSDLERTVSELKSVRGDLGVQSGLIATNAAELAALRALGERNYYEFKIARSKGFQKVGDVQVQLAKADPKRNKYSLRLIADDKRVEKLDKTINEPVQFYVGGARQPLEIVVNEVTRDQIVGYLATPKVMQARSQTF